MQLTQCRKALRRDSCPPPACIGGKEHETMNQEINIKKIPQFQLDRLSSPLIDAVSKYFEDPKVQKEFEAWQQSSKAVHTV